MSAHPKLYGSQGSADQRALACHERATFRRRDEVFLIIVGVIVLGLSLVYNEFGFIYSEWWGDYISFHLGPGSIWRKMFNCHVLDSGLYLGRELSYLVDHIDMRLMAWTVNIGFPVFL